MKQRVSSLLLLVVLAFVPVGCQSTGKGAKALASVEIHGNTPGQVKAMAIEVFRDHGYTVTESGRDKLLCDQPASKWTELAYGGWGEMPLFIRVTVAIIPLPEQTCRLEAQAYRVEDRGSAVERAVPISRRHRGDCQKLLDEVARRFNARSTPGS